MQASDKDYRAEFDLYADGYQGGMEDPIKQALGKSLDAYLEVKAKWLLGYVKRYPPPSAKSPEQISLLDFGCGTGQFICTLKKNGYEGRLEGCDVSERMIDEAKVRWGASHPPFNAMNDGVIPHKADSFDIGVACCVFHHIAPDDRKRAYAEVVRVLKPGGRFFVFEHNPYNPITRLIVKRAAIDKNAVLLAAKEVSALMRDAGMVEIKRRYILFFPPVFRNRFSEAIERMLSHFPLGGQYVVIGEKPRT